MEIITFRSEMTRFSNQARNKGKTVGFVPTMGALHLGHLKLVEQAMNENDIVICSIFVNPVQFNNPLDLEKYPRTFDEDIRLLKELGCDAVFAPTVAEMYPEPVNKQYEFGLLDKVMEGEFRPGHFNGVAIVVSKLFNIVKPHKAFFGEKDYQQLAVIRELVRQEKLPVEIIACPTIREIDGLAMSSRNKRLSEDQRRQAPLIYKTLSMIPELVTKHSVNQVKEIVTRTIISNPGIDIEYFEISDATTLAPLNNLVNGTKVVACIAVFMGDVRLIDNITFNC